MSNGYIAKWIITSNNNLHEDCTLIIEGDEVEKIVKTCEIKEGEYNNLKD